MPLKKIKLGDLFTSVPERLRSAIVLTSVISLTSLQACTMGQGLSTGGSSKSGASGTSSTSGGSDGSSGGLSGLIGDLLGTGTPEAGRLTLTPQRSTSALTSSTVRLAGACNGELTRVSGQVLDSSGVSLGTGQVDCSDDDTYELDISVSAATDQILSTVVEEISLSDASVVSSKTVPYYYRAARSTDGQVYTQASDGTSLFLGGRFHRVAPETAWKTAALNTSTAQASSLHSLIQGFDDRVRVLLVSGTSLYAGGDFTSFRGRTASRLAKIDLLTGELDTTFTQETGPTDHVYAMILANGSLYVGGDFTAYRGTTANRLIKVDPSSGDMDATFNRALCSGCSQGFTSGVVYALAADSSSIYVGGTFKKYRSSTNNISNIAKLDLSSGALDVTFSGAIGFSSRVYSLAVDGTSLFAGGVFSSYRSTAVGRIAKISTTDGALDATFYATPAVFDQTVNRVVVSGSKLYVGGSFTTVTHGATVTNASGLTALNTTDGSLIADFNPTAALAGESMTTDVVNDLLLSGNDLYVAGEFSRTDGKNQTSVVKVNAASGAVDEPFDGAASIENTAYGLALYDGSLLVAGTFTAMGGTPAGGLAQINLASGLPVENLPSLQLTAAGELDSVFTLALQGTSLYVGGMFSVFGGVEAKNIAKVDLSSRSVDTAFSANAGFDSFVTSLAIQSGALFAGGNFQNYGPSVATPAAYLAKLSLTDGSLQSLFRDPTHQPDNSVSVLTPFSTTHLCMGGTFSTLGGAPAFRVGCINASDGSPVLLPPLADPASSPKVYSMAATSDALLIGGIFENSDEDGTTTSYLKKVQLSSDESGVLTSLPSPAFDLHQPSYRSEVPIVYSLLVSGDSLYVAGAFDHAGAVETASFAKYSLSTGEPDASFVVQNPTGSSTPPSITHLLNLSGGIYATVHRDLAEDTSDSYELKINPTTGALQ